MSNSNVVVGVAVITIARELSQKEIMNKITDSQQAYNWAIDIGDKDEMIKKISDPMWAYYWAVDIGDSELRMSAMPI